MAKLLIVEDDLLISEDIKDICELASHEVVEIAYTSGQALLALKEHRPDLILLDINLEGEIDGIELAQYIDKNYGIPYIFITSYSDEITLNKISTCNSSGYIVKPFTPEQLQSTITLSLHSTNVQSDFNSRFTAKKIELSDREIEILRLLLLGQSREQIAENIFVSVNTVKYHIKNLYRKVNVSSQVELMRWWNM